MGLKNMFKAPKDMSKEQSKEVLEMNGMITRNDADPHRRKFKFGEFSKFARDKTSAQEPLRPRGWVDPNAPPATDSASGSNSSGTADDSYDPATQSTIQSNTYEATTSTDPYKLQRETSNNSHAPTYQTYDPYGEQDPYSGQSQAELLIERQQQQQQQSDKASYVQQDQDLDFNSYPGASAANEYQSTAYDPYLDQQGWQEQQEMDEEEEEINRIRRQTKDVRDATVKSTQNILGHLRQADDTATNTMGALGAQREKMYEIESNLNIMSTQQRFVNEHVKELEHYNRSLFHIKASNPFTKKSRAKAAEDKFLAQRQADRDRDSSLNTQLYHSQNTIVDQLKGPRDSPALQSDLRDKYDYERRAKEAKGFLTEDHDEEDERMEVELSKNLDEAAKLTNNLKSKAQAISNEIISQNRGLKEISEKVNKVDDSVVLTTNRIRGI
ncbi:hypothetical protein CANARDRAFT_231328 [[Candida] arabinofermentans NRRL YB-2248]|uniref:t-SNARE coiled-coil homology domain-containing protein n=1 Tax=[Candida] arabinofermentans NRRL YB-2248 TaxID=983967 RepID=A0A1E4T5F6_9ASCO|nr:hypothetical protein CANARDRAFT_231328 [[Candida] arabinofermentans NRRL YB-2248]